MHKRKGMAGVNKAFFFLFTPFSSILSQKLVGVNTVNIKILVKV